MKLGVLSDVHLPARPDERGAWHNPYDYAGLRVRVQRALRWFSLEGIDGLVVLGDLAEHGDLDSLRAALALLHTGWRGPTVVVEGNHDCLERDDQLERARARCRARLVPHVPAAETTLLGVQLRTRGAGHDGAWPPISGPGPVVVASHFPVLSRRRALAARGLRYAGDLVNRGELERALLDGGGPVVVLSGHLHVRDAHHEGALLQLSMAAVVEPPFECAVVEVRGERDRVRVERRCRPLRAVAAPVAPILAPERAAWDWAGGEWRQV